LDSPQARAVQVAAHVIGRHGGKPHVKPLTTAIRSWHDHWNKRRQQLRREQQDGDGELTGMTDALVWLTWAAGRVGAGKAELLELLGSHPADQQFSEVRRMAAQSLASVKLGKADLKRLAAALEDPDAAIRQAAAAALGSQAPEQTATFAAQMISDRPVFSRLTSTAPKTSKKGQTDAGLAAALEAGARHPHYQSVVLPQLVAAGDVDCLANVAADGGLQESTRIGAVEGLARIASAAGDEQLARIGNDQQAGEELRKAAWRGLRRSKRQQAAKESGN
jgi:ParB family chromosome partitioning protein